MTPKVYIMVGCCGSGKSTVAKSIAQEVEDTVVVSTDAIRKELCDDVNDQRKNREVFQLAFSLLNMYLREGLNVVFDATNVTTRARNEVVKNIKMNCQIQFVYVKVDLKVALARVESRNNGQNVPEEVVKRMYYNMELSERELLDCPIDVLVIKNNKEIDKKILDKVVFV